MKTIGSIESFTGGLFASTIVSKSGCSSFYKGGIIAYSNKIKQKFNIDTSKGVINKEVAMEMSLKGKEFLNVDICVSFTGNAGPSVIENKPIGLVYIAINEKVYELYLKGSRNKIQKDAVEFALKKLNI